MKMDAIKRSGKDTILLFLKSKSFEVSPLHDFFLEFEPFEFTCFKQKKLIHINYFQTFKTFFQYVSFSIQKTVYPRSLSVCQFPKLFFSK